MLCVINEWIFHDIDGGNGKDAQRRAGLFLQAFLRGPDQLLILRESQWTRKAWQLWAHQDVVVQLLSKALYTGILINSAKCIYLEHSQAPELPPTLAAQVPAKDVYLFQTAIAGNPAAIVTTDERLIDLVIKPEEYGIELVLRDDFYARYHIR